MLTSWVLVDFSVVMLLNLAATAWLRRRPVHVFKVNRIHMGARGLALPGVIFLVSPDERVLRHELVHQEQMRRWTPLGTALLIGFHYARLAAFHVVSRHTWPRFEELYVNHPLEREAHDNPYSGPLPTLTGWPLPRA